MQGCSGMDGWVVRVLSDDETRVTSRGAGTFNSPDLRVRVGAEGLVVFGLC